MHIFPTVNRVKYCPDCGVLFCYDSREEGLSDEDNPMDPCPECGCTRVTVPDLDIFGGITVLIGEQ
jgi:hypothetical protein